MLRVCIATTSFPRRPGDGRGAFVWETCRALRGLGIEVRVVTPHAPGAKERESFDGVEVFRARYLPREGWETVAAESGGLPAFWESRRLGRAAILPYGISHALAIARHARDCDLIHAHWTFSGFAAWIGGRLHGRPVVCTVQGSDVYRAMRGPAAGWCSRRALNGARRVIALSRDLARTAQERGVRSDRMRIIPHGVDCRFFHPDEQPRRPVLLFAGSLIERKGIRFLLRSMAQVRTAHPQHTLAVLGDGPQRRELERLTADLGLETAVSFLGDQPPAAVAEWMRRAELFILPSLEEGQGVVVLEALASETPCVASRVGGIPEMLPPEWGTLVPPGDSGALAEAIVALLRQPEKTRSMGEQARLGVCERFDSRVEAARILAVYREALSSSSGRAVIPE
jgi:glycosyltransferase involved in cell wall biosynthesis